MRDIQHYPTWVPPVVRSLTEEWVGQSLRAAEIAKDNAGAAAIQEQQEAGQVALERLARQVHALAVAGAKETPGVVLHPQLLELETAIRRQAAGGAAAVKRAEQAAAKRWEEDAQNITRIVANPRMRTVWQELDRRQSDGSYLYPARISVGRGAVREGFNSEADWKQALAYEQLFAAQIALARYHRVRSISEEERYRAAATALRSQAQAERANPDFGLLPERDPRRRFADRLAGAAAAANQCAAAILADDRKQRRQRLAGSLSDKFIELFDQEMQGLTAIMTGVILNETVSRKTVRLATAKRGRP
jgi:hypothetical protein